MNKVGEGKKIESPQTVGAGNSPLYLTSETESESLSNSNISNFTEDVNLSKNIKEKSRPYLGLPKSNKSHQSAGPALIKNSISDSSQKSNSESSIRLSKADDADYLNTNKKTAPELVNMTTAPHPTPKTLDPSAATAIIRQSLILCNEKGLDDLPRTGLLQLPGEGDLPDPINTIYTNREDVNVDTKIFYPSKCTSFLYFEKIFLSYMRITPPFLGLFI